MPKTTSQRQDDRDRKTCLEMYAPPMGRCIGGRIRVVGYVCTHCNSMSPEEECHAPKQERKQHLQKIVGQRIWREKV